MIPYAAEIGFRRGPWRRRNLWVPLALLWILLFPLAVVLVPVLFIACLMGDVNPFLALRTVWGILTSLNDTELSIDKREFSVFVHLY